jgi:DNA-binding transcriptional MerR regulator
MDAKDYTVAAVAGLTGLSVRTLHHYDQTDLLQPSERSAAGYRLYSPRDLQRLQRVLFYRELGFGLDTIAVIIDDHVLPTVTACGGSVSCLPPGSRAARQWRRSSTRSCPCASWASPLPPQERLEVFGSIPLEDLADEAEQGLGGTAEWPQQQRTSGYTVQDWQQLLAESASIHQRLLDAMNSGVPAGDPAVMDLAEEHRQHTDRWYHDCGHEIHRQYAQAHLANDDDMPPGLAQYCHVAIIANCQRAADARTIRPTVSAPPVNEKLPR